MMRSMYKVPANLWCVGLTHLSNLRMKQSHMTERGNSRTAWEVVTGDTLDISEFLYFHFYQPVTFYDPVSFPDSKDEMGRWIGSSDNVRWSGPVRLPHTHIKGHDVGQVHGFHSGSHLESKRGPISRVRQGTAC